MKGMLVVFATIGSLIGGYAPSLFGSNNLFLSVVLGGVGGIIGIWLGWKFINDMGD
jgi:hypothetical protein